MKEWPQCDMLFDADGWGYGGDLISMQEEELG
jgi:hypothetical protein